MRWWLVLVTLFVVLAGAWLLLGRRVDRARDGLNGLAESKLVVAKTVPQEPGDGYVASQACQECHAKHYSSWHQTYHRSMTQALSPESMLAPLTERMTLQTRGRSSHLWRQGDDYWVDMIDPDWELELAQRGLSHATDADNPPRVRRQIVMATGSHHMQIYWVNSVHATRLHQVPWVYHLGEQRWLPLQDVFLVPPETPPHLHATWNEVCIQCHTVHGQPGLDERTGLFHSKVSEFGVACEACHGPGQRHVELARTARDDLNSATLTPDETHIVNPPRLTHDSSSQVCGQCHSDFMITDSRFWARGHRFRPGDDLTETHPPPPFEPGSGFEAYWDDGTARVGGREFTAMAASTCYLQGELSCLSCHSMHQSDPNDQLLDVAKSDQACLQCHESYDEQIEQHTHHPRGSAGSRCYNCHMPYSTFALMKQIRSHRIDSPSVETTLRFHRPNACNQCHLDQTLAWTAEHLADWYGHAPAEISEPHDRIPAAVHMLLTGDAVQRAVTAANFGWDAARQASTADWPPAVLALLLNDPYAVVRFVAAKSLRTYAAFEAFDYDYIGPIEARKAASERALRMWRERRSDLTNRDASVLIDSNGEFNLDLARRFLEQRNDRPVALPE